MSEEEVFGETDLWGTLCKYLIQNCPKYCALGNDLLEKLLLATPRDFVLVYWFYTPSSDFKKMMASLRERGILNLLITDTQSPPMIEDAHMILYAQRGSFGVFHYYDRADGDRKRSYHRSGR